MVQKRILVERHKFPSEIRGGAPAEKRVSFTSVTECFSLRCLCKLTSCHKTVNGDERKTSHQQASSCSCLETLSIATSTEEIENASVRASASIKATSFDTNRKPVCHFLLVNNTNLHRISNRFQVIVEYISQLFAFDKAVSLFNVLIRGESLNSQAQNLAPKN